MASHVTFDSTSTSIIQNPKKEKSSPRLSIDVEITTKQQEILKDSPKGSSQVRPRFWSAPQLSTHFPPPPPNSPLFTATPQNPFTRRTQSSREIKNSKNNQTSSSKNENANLDAIGNISPRKTVSESGAAKGESPIIYDPSNHFKGAEVVTKTEIKKQNVGFHLQLVRSLKSSSEAIPEESENSSESK